ncbi:hypothetical protein [Azospirillum sp. sgz302134]
MTMNHHIALRHVAIGFALLMASLVIGVGLFSGAVALPGSPALAVSPSLESATSLALPMSSVPPVRVEDRQTNDGPVTDTGMDVIPVFD